MPVGTPSAGPAMTPAGTMNMNLDLAFNRAGRKAKGKRLWYKSMRIGNYHFCIEGFANAKDSETFAIGNRFDVGRFVIGKWAVSMRVIQK